ncbi:MAG: leucine-rich repeat protein, partial [Clostridia bacterium]|nr:leucine-rich repeat protein [Clostridia bacterium]
MKKIIIYFVFATLLCLAFALGVGAKSVYLEEIPDELRYSDADTITHFVVFEDENYFTISGTTITALNTDNMLADMTSADIDTTKIGTTYLTRFNFPSGITAIDFEKVKSTTYFSGVAGYIQLPSTMTSVNNLRGQCSQLRCLDFSEGSQITSVGAYFCEGANKLMSVKNFPSNLSVVGNDAFSGCYNAFKGELYVNATTIGSNAFNNAIANVTKLTLGPNVTKIDAQAFTARMAELTSGKPTDGEIQIAEIEFQCDVSAVTFNSNAFYFGGAWARTPYSKLENIILSHPNNEKLVVDGVSVLNDFTNSTVLFDGTDGSDYFVTAIHNFVDGIRSYENFLSEGVIVCTCTDCGATTTKNAPALFTCLGYSAPEFGEGGIAIGFVVNHDSIDQYEKVTNSTVEYGVFAIVKDRLGENDIFDEDGN